MHWSADVYHAPEFTYSNVHPLLKTSHLWILLEGLCRSSIVPFSLHKDQDQDQTNVHFLSTKGKSLCSLNLNTIKNTQGKENFFCLGLLIKKKVVVPIIQNLIESYIQVVLISYFLLFSTRNLISFYWKEAKK